MILIDDRKGSAELLPYIHKFGIPAMTTRLMYGDFCFDGNAKGGPVTIGIERKTLHDMLNCIDDARYAASQRPGMAQMYGVSILVLEGMWKPHTLTGNLMEFFKGTTWGECRYRTGKVKYSKLSRYLLSLAHSGVIITQTRDIEHTAWAVCDMFGYYQKRWEDHTSLLEVQKFAIPTMDLAPDLVTKWAYQLDHIGSKLAQECRVAFKSGHEMANADESAWVRVSSRIGPKTAIRIVKQIRNWR